MDIEVFKRVGTSGFNFKSAGILDVFESLTVNWRYYTYSQFSLKILLEDVQKIIFNNSEEIQRRKDILFSLFISDNILNINDVYFILIE